MPQYIVVLVYRLIMARFRSYEISEVDGLINSNNDKDKEIQRLKVHLADLIEVNLLQQKKIERQNETIENYKNLVSNKRIMEVEVDKLLFKGKYKKLKVNDEKNHQMHIRKMYIHHELKQKYEELVQQQQPEQAEIPDLEPVVEVQIPISEVPIDEASSDIEVEATISPPFKECEYSQTGRNDKIRKKFTTRMNNYKILSKHEQAKYCKKCYRQFTSIDHLKNLGTVETVQT
jgi:hypothetical protein